MSQTLPVPLSVVADLRRARQKQRVAEIHWIDALYQVYISGLAVVAAVALLSTVIGDERLTAAGIRHVQAEAPAWLGVLVALAFFVGLRSGSRGGPLAIEAADVRHILLAPVDRGGALRGPALRQLRFIAFAAIGVGAASGQFASRRFHGNALEWILCGALLGLTIAGLSNGSALVASSRRLPSWAATIVGGTFLVWAIGDVASDAVPTAPTTIAGRIAIWPLHFDPVGVVAPVFALVLVAVGLWGIAGVSLEAAERRSSLVGQLRFAVTLQDLRTVLVLRRQLAADLPRSRPWIPTMRGPGKARFPVWQRGWRGVFRWPLPRVLRVIGVGIGIGFCVHGLANGTTPLLVAGGLLLWVAGLDSVEPLAQETDHPGRRDSYPIDDGVLMLRHMGVPTVVMLFVAAIAAGTAIALGGEQVSASVLAISALSMAVAGVCGAVVSVLMGAPKPFDDFALASPEFAGMRTVLRTIWPPFVACTGLLPVLFARNATGKDVDPLRSALLATVLVVVLGSLVAGWVRSRAQIKAWWASAAEAAMNPSATDANRNDDEDEVTR